MFKTFWNKIIFTQYVVSDQNFLCLRQTKIVLCCFVIAQSIQPSWVSKPTMVFFCKSIVNWHMRKYFWLSADPLISISFIDLLTCVYLYEEKHSLLLNKALMYLPQSPTLLLSRNPGPKTILHWTAKKSSVHHPHLYPHSFWFTDFRVQFLYNKWTRNSLLVL